MSISSNGSSGGGDNTVVSSPDEALVEIINELTMAIPNNEFGMPAYIYRPDHIPPNFKTLSAANQRRQCELAKVPLYYSDGFPTTRRGSLIWDRLDHEGNCDFMLFRQYLEMSQAHGYRSIQVLARALCEQTTATNRHIESIREERKENPNIFLDVEELPASQAPTQRDQWLTQSSEEDGITNTLGSLRQLYVFYFWRQRAEAYDLVGQAAVRKIRESRAILLEDHHFIQLSNMVAKVMKRFDNFGEDDMNNLNPVETVRILKELVSMQRVATGLPGNAPSESHLPGQRDETGTSSVEDHLRNINKAKATESQGDTSGFLEDEDTTTLAQALFMKMMRKNQENR